MGNIIRKQMIEKRIDAKAVAKQLGISRNSVYEMLKRHYIHPRWVEKISRALNYDLYQHLYCLPDDFLKKNKNEAQQQINKELSALKKQVEELQKENAYLKEINELRKGKKK